MFTAAGALLNEGTALHDMFVKEVISRCSYAGSKILIDTNPENPAHSVKKDYIDKDGQRLDNGRLNIKAFNFTLFDNDQLDPEYVESIVAATPSGMYFERDVLGLWVSGEGVVYKDFNKDKHYITSEIFAQKERDIVKCFAGVDWGWNIVPRRTVMYSLELSEPTNVGCANLICANGRNLRVKIYGNTVLSFIYS